MASTAENEERRSF